MSTGHTDTAAQPLISNEDERSERSHSYDEDAGVDESQLVSPGLFVSILTICAGISGLLFGYDTGIISSTLVTISSDLSSRPLSTVDKSLITSCTSLSALLFSPLSGHLADHLGRKPVLLIADALFVLGALWQALTTTVPGMIAGRSVVGAAVGAASCIAPLYIGELAPAPFRGRLVVVSSLMITAGQVVAYLVGWGFSGLNGGWRWMVGIGAVPAVVQVILLVFMPESPRWAVRAGQVEKARTVLGKVYGGSEGLVRVVMRRMEREVWEEDGDEGLRNVPESGKPGWRAHLARTGDRFAQLLHVPGNRRALMIACFLQGFQQLSGFNSLMYFSATIFALVGFRSPTLTSLCIATTNFLFTLLAFYYIDKVGRRRILLLSVPVMVFGLAICAVAFEFLDLPAEKASLSGFEGNTGATVWPVVLLVAMVTYVAGYAVGIGNIPWQQGELFPLSVRSIGSGLSTTTNWTANFLISITFLPFMSLLTPVGTFCLYAFICLAAWGVAWGIYPETVGLGLEDVSELLKDGFNVKGSVARSRERRRIGQ